MSGACVSINPGREHLCRFNVYSSSFAPSLQCAKDEQPRLLDPDTLSGLEEAVMLVGRAMEPWQHASSGGVKRLVCRVANPEDYRFRGSDGAL